MWIHPHTMASHQIFLSKTGNNFYVDISLSQKFASDFIVVGTSIIYPSALLFSKKKMYSRLESQNGREINVFRLKPSKRLIIFSSKVDAQTKEIKMSAHSSLKQPIYSVVCLFKSLILMLQAYHSFITHPPCLSLPNSNCSKRLGQTH